MSTHNRNFIIAILAAVSFAGIIPAYAAYLEQACPDCTSEKLDQQEALKKLIPVLVWSDKTTYDHQSIIMVTGHVKDPNTTQHITLRVTDPDGNVVQVNQLEVDMNGDFKTELKTTGALWKQNGFYTIRVQYGTDIKSNQIRVELTGEVVGICGQSQLEAKLGNKSYCIPYIIDGKTVVLGGILDTAAKSLIINIKVESDGSVSLDIPRSVLDAKARGNDDVLIVLVDGEEVKTQETKTSTTRTIVIPLAAGNEKIEIIGTQIVPEFGAIAALVLAIAIISIIAVSAKTRLRLMPKY